MHIESFDNAAAALRDAARALRSQASNPDQIAANVRTAGEALERVASQLQNAGAELGDLLDDLRKGQD